MPFANRPRAFFLIGFVCATVTACDFNDPKSGTSAPDLSGINGTIPGYETLRGEIFVPYCISCHGNSGGVNLETYAAAVSAASAIGQAVSNRVMPQNGALTDPEIAMIEAWVNGGAPETDVAASPAPSAPTPSPSPSASPSALTYATIAAQVFTPYCISCHGSSGSGGISLDTYASVVANISQVDQAALVSRVMPPSGSLPATLQALLQQWITEGTPQ